MREVTLEELTAFVDCPARWLYKYFYKADAHLSIDECFCQAFRVALLCGMRLRMQGGARTPEDFAEAWAMAWTSFSTKFGAKKNEFKKWGNIGARSMLNVITAIETHYTPVMAGHDWEYTWPEFDITVRDSILAVLKSIEPVTSAEGRMADARHRFYVLEVLPASARNRPRPQALRLLQLAGEACRGGIPAAARDSAPEIWTLAVDPWRGTVEQIPDVMFSDVEVLVGNALNQMHYQLVLPHENQQCGGCSYKPACDSKLLKKSSLDNPTRTRKYIEERTCTTTPSSFEISPSMEDFITQPGYRPVYREEKFRDLVRKKNGTGSGGASPTPTQK